MPARTYAQWGGAVLVALGIGGLFAGRALLALNAELPMDLLHLLAGGVLLWAGQAGQAPARLWAALVGAALVAAGLVGFIDGDLFGLLDYDTSTVGNAGHVVLGVLGLGAGWRSTST